MTKQIFSAIKVTTLALALSFGLSYVYAWTAPVSQPPTGNVSAPLNTSGTAQTKSGNLTVGALSASTLSAPTHCIGADCRTTWPTTAAAAGDNLGNHIATEGIAMNNNLISNASAVYLNSTVGIFNVPNLFGKVAGTWTTTAAAEGRVLTSDDMGNATWRTGGSIPSGAVMFFSLASCPAGWVAANGTGGTPDLRGEFIRGLDSGRGVDSGRTLSSAQTGMIESHTHVVHLNASNTSGPNSQLYGIGNLSQNVSQNVTSNATGGTETRPRNVALLACVKS